MTERRHYSEKTRLRVFDEITPLLEEAAQLWLEFVEGEPPSGTTANVFLAYAESAYFRRCHEIGREAYGATNPVRLEMGGPGDWDLDDFDDPDDDFTIVRDYGEGE